MAKPGWLGVCSMVFFAVAAVSCGTRDEDKSTTKTRSALTASLFRPYVTYPTGSPAQVAAIADLDGDGRNDIVVTTGFRSDPANDYMLHVFLQDADGSLKPPAKYAIGQRCDSMDVGDVNGDGRADVVVGMFQPSSPGHVGVFLQNAAGTLDPMVSYAAANTYQVKVGDFNGDGRADVAAMSFGGSSLDDGVDVLLQTETGTLSAPVTYHVLHGGFGELDAGDIDGDGRTDLLVMSGSGNDRPDVNLLLQASDGTLGPPVSYSLAGQVNANGVALGDTNGDGRSDVVVTAHSTTSFISRFLQQADGTFAAPVSYPSPLTESPMSIVLADVNQDSRKDALVVHDGYRLGVYPQTDTGDFGAEDLYPIAYTSGHTPQELAVGDVNSDGLPDVVIANRNFGLVVLRHAETAPAITITSPVFKTYYFNAPLTISWTVADGIAASSFDVTYSTDGGVTYAPIAACTGLAGSARECLWTLAVVPAPGIRVRVSARDGGSELASAEAIFDVEMASLTVLGPVFEVYTGTTTTVVWEHNLPTTDTVKIELSRNGGSSYSETLAAAAPNTGSFPWTVTGPTCTSCRIRITYNGPVAITPRTGPNFSILTPSLTVTSPVVGANHFGGGMTVRWTTNVLSATSVRIELSRDGGATYETLTAAASSGPTGTGSFTTIVPGPDAPDARMRVTTNGAVTASGTNAFAIIIPAIALTSPTAGATSLVGAPFPITWSSNVPATSSIRIELSRDGGSTYAILATVANSGTYMWTPAAPSTSTARIRVTAVAGPQPSSTSGVFAIANPSLAVTGPSGTVLTGASTAVTWSTNLPATDNVRIELSRDGGFAFEVLAAAAPNTGTFSWIVTGPETSLARVRVTSLGSVALSATTAGVFQIVASGLTIVSPTTGSIMFAPALQVTWTLAGVSATTVRIELSRDGGATFVTLASAAPTGPTFGAFTGTAPGPDTTNARVRVTTNGPSPASGTTGVFSFLSPVLDVPSPAAGTTNYVATPLSITWATNLTTATTARIELSRDGGSTYELLSASAPNTGSFSWMSTGPATGNARVRIVISGMASTSGVFAIAVPTLTVTNPVVVYTGTSAAITWSHNLPATDTVHVELSRDGGASFETLAASAPNTGNFAWDVTGPDIAAAQVRVTSNGTVAASGTSGSFAIVTPSLVVLAPVGGDVVYGSWLSVSWTSTVATATTVRVELSRDGGATYQVLDAAAPNGPLGGTFSGMALGPDTANARVRVTTNGPIVASSTSGAFAMLTPAVAVTSPAVGASLFVGTPLSITWSTNLPAGAPVVIELSRDGGTSFETLAAAAPNTGSFDWAVVGPDTAAAAVRVTVNGPVTAGASSGAFTIATPSLAVTGPAAGATVLVGSPATITWTSNLPASDAVQIELSRDGGSSYAVLASAAPNTGSFAWTATGPDAAEARIRITGNGAVSATGVGGTFAIVTRSVVVTSPGAGANWAIGTARTIAWTGSNLPGGTTVRVELSRNGGGTWTTLSASAAASGTLAWTVTAPATTTALVRVSANGGVAAVGTSGVFTIGSPALAVTSPVAGASWVIGTAQTITWTSNLLPSTTVKVQLSRNGGSTYTTLASTAPNTGSYAWTASGAATTTAIVKLVANGISANAVSGQFTLVAGTATVTSPNTAVSWKIGTVQTITWSHNAGVGADFKIEVSRSGVWSVIAAAAPATGATTGSFAWSVIGPTSTNAKVRVTWNANTAAKDTSDVSFKIVN